MFKNEKNFLEIGKRKIGNGKPTFIIAEIGINHNGDFELAKKMVDEAANCGVDAVKIQTLLPEELFSKKLNSEVFDYVQTLSFNKKQHLELKKRAEKNGIEFLSTPVGIKTAKLLHEIKSKAFKIASGEINNLDLVEQIAKYGKPVIVSTGMSTLSEIIIAIEKIQEHDCPFAILHCISCYPTKTKDANLSTITHFQEIFDVPVGYSDHTLGNDACLTAVALGAKILEKHFTLDKNMEGPDQKLSGDVNEFKELVQKTRNIEKSIGIPRTKPYSSEIKFKNIMRVSIGTSKNIKSGTKITKSMLTYFRPGTGIPPTMIDKIIGLKINQDVEKGIHIKWNMLN
jgi:N,N'-diacetyllegionaminate synthase